MLEEDLETAIKVIIVGNGGVGKSSMIQRYCKGTFTSDYKKTIGVDFLEKQVEIDGYDIRMMLWDTARQEEFDAITKAYYRGAQACVLTFSITDRTSFNAIPCWKQKVENECGGGLPIVLVQNKIDLIEETYIASEEVEEMSSRIDCRVIRTSVKENINVDLVFRYLASKCHQIMHCQFSMQPYLPQINHLDSEFYVGKGTIVLKSSKELNQKRKMIKICGL